MIRLVLVDDHDLLREGIRALLEKEPGFEILAETGDGQEAIELVERLEPDVVLMDVNLPGGLGGLEAAEAIRQRRPKVRIIVLTQYENPEYIKRALRIGVNGYLPKRAVSSQLREAIREVHAGHRYLHPVAAEEVLDLVATGRSLDQDDWDALTPRERQVFKLLAEGKTSREIAQYLHISLKTAMTHRSNLMAKLGLHSRAELIRWAIRRSILPVDESG
jgi:DNA-binding NarL/FixJ family response regulator